MEAIVTYRRKVYKVSKDSWVVTVPPEWVGALEKRGAVKTERGGFEVRVNILQDGNLLIEPVIQE